MVPLILNNCIYNYSIFFLNLSLPVDESKTAAQLAFYVNLHRAVIGPSATLTGRWRPDIDLRRMLTGWMHTKSVEPNQIVVYTGLFKPIWSNTLGVYCIFTVITATGSASDKDSNQSAQLFSEAKRKKKILCHKTVGRYTCFLQLL